MNKTATLLLKWMTKRHPRTPLADVKQECRHIWDTFGEKAVKSALNHSACTSPAQLKKILKYKRNEKRTN